MRFASEFLRFSKVNILSINIKNHLSTSLVTSLKQESNALIVSSHIDGVSYIGMNYQTKKNALSRCFVSALSDAVAELEFDKKSKATILYSLVNNVFCAGADLSERANVPDKDTPALVAGLRSLFHRVYALPMPTIAAIDGAAFGGGLELALACDIRYAGILPKCQLGLVETHWALLPGAGGSQRLPRIIGESRAKELMFSALRMSSEKAADYNVVNAAIHPDSVPSEWKSSPALYQAVEYAKAVCTKGPVAVRQLKKAVNHGLQAGSIDAGLSIEGQCYFNLVSTNDRKEGMNAFIQKREPKYRGD